MMADPISVWSSFLASPEAPRTAMSALELDGYLTGVIVTPPQAAAIRPSAWRARLCAEERAAEAENALKRIETMIRTLISETEAKDFSGGVA